MTLTEMEDSLTKVKKALQSFFKKDSDLLYFNVNERSITHKLAEHLQNSFSEFSELKVDCEYNRKGDDRKSEKVLANNDKVFPDIVVHQRGNNNENRLVIETKKKGRSIRRDIEKLQEFTGPLYKYKIGLLFVFDVKNKCLHKILCFRNGSEITSKAIRDILKEFRCAE